MNSILCHHYNQLQHMPTTVETVILSAVPKKNGKMPDLASPTRQPQASLETMGNK
jgi:hypothetical protein